MTDVTNPDSKPALGVGNLISEAFSLFVKNAGPLILIGAIPSVVSVLLNLSVYGPIVFDSLAAFNDPLSYAEATNVGLFWQIALPLIGLVLYAVITGATTRAAFEAKMGNPIRVGECFMTAANCLVPLTICMLVVLLVAILGLYLLIIPGLYIMAMWSSVVPAIVVERIGFGSFGRSYTLTKGYRWPMVGFWVLVLLILIVMSLVAAGMQLILIGFGTVGIGLTVLFSTVVGAVIYGLSSVFSALAYARLRQIKEGTAVSDLAKVFE